MNKVVVWALGAALAASLAFNVLQHTNVLGLKVELSAVKQKHADAVAVALSDGLKRSETYRKEETRREAEKQEVIAHAQAETKTARAAAATAARQRDSLQRQLADYSAAVRRATVDPGAGPGVASTSDPIGLLGRLFSESDQVAGELAEAADASRTAGLSCERQYDSLTRAK